MHPAEVAIINPPFGDIIRAHHCSYITCVLVSLLFFFSESMMMIRCSEPARVYTVRNSCSLASPRAGDSPHCKRSSSRMGFHVHLITRHRELTIHGPRIDGRLTLRNRRSPPIIHEDANCKRITVIARLQTAAVEQQSISRKLTYVYVCVHLIMRSHTSISGLAIQL